MAKDQDQDKEQKPKKLFSIEITVWDDGECEAAMHEFRDSPTGRGRPGKWRLTAPDFVNRIEEILGDYNKCLADWNKAIGKEAKQFMGVAAPAQMMAQASQSSVIAPVVIKKEEKKKDKPKKEETQKDEFDGMEFGEFDKDNNPK